MTSHFRASHRVAVLALATLAVVVFVAGCGDTTDDPPPPPPNEDKYSLAVAESFTNTLSMMFDVFEGPLPQQLAPDVTLGGDNHPIIANPGQSIIITDDQSMMWVSLLNTGFALYRDPLTGGDRAPDVLLPEESSDTIWYDNTRDILYTVRNYDIHAWDDASQMTQPRPFDRAINMGYEMRLASITGDPVNDRLYIMTGNFPHSLLRVDDASTLTGRDHEPSAVIEPTDTSGNEGIAYDHIRDVLYVGRGHYLTGTSIGIIPNASQADGSVADGDVAMNIVEGPATGIDTVIVSLQVFPDTDTLFVAANDVLMFNNASGITGNRAPDDRKRVVTSMTGAYVFRQQ